MITVVLGLAVFDHEMLVPYADLVAMHTEIRDEIVPHRLQNYLIDHLWVTKKIAHES
jgi:hypothetical protein